MNVTQMAMNYVRFQWEAAGKVISLSEYRRRRWLAKHARPMPPKDAA
jgi:hypothetical protein